MRVQILAFTLAVGPFLAQAQEPASIRPNVELLLKGGKLVNGVPDAFTFVFVNTGDHEVRLPPVSPCIGNDTGWLLLWLEFTPVKPQGGGEGGGCGGSVNHGPKLMEQVKGWRVLSPGDSYQIRFPRIELFSKEQRPGKYDFWAEYRPPTFSPEDQRMLNEAGIDFPRTGLKSEHVAFRRKR